MKNILCLQTKFNEEKFNSLIELLEKIYYSVEEENKSLECWLLEIKNFLEKNKVFLNNNWKNIIKIVKKEKFDDLEDSEDIIDFLISNLNKYENELINLKKINQEEFSKQLILTKIRTKIEIIYFIMKNFSEQNFYSRGLCNYLKKFVQIYLKI